MFNAQLNLFDCYSVYVYMYSSRIILDNGLYNLPYFYEYYLTLSRWKMPVKIHFLLTLRMQTLTFLALPRNNKMLIPRYFLGASVFNVDPLFVLSFSLKGLSAHLW